MLDVVKIGAKHLLNSDSFSTLTMTSADGKQEVVTQRIAIITVLLAIFYGVLQLLPDSTKLPFGWELAIKVIAKTCFGLVSALSVLYLLCLAINRSYNVPVRFPQLEEFFYDVAVVLTAFISAFTLLLVFGLWLITQITNPTAAVVLAFAYVLGMCLVMAVFLRAAVDTYIDRVVTIIVKRFRR